LPPLSDPGLSCSGLEAVGVAILFVAFAFYELRLWVGDFSSLRYYGFCWEVGVVSPSMWHF